MIGPMFAPPRLHARIVRRAVLLAWMMVIAAPPGPAPAAVPDATAPVPVGVAQVDITPDYLVRLSGFGFRRDESEGVTQRIWAKALAFGDDREGPAVLITTDNLGVPI